MRGEESSEKTYLFKWHVKWVFKKAYGKIPRLF